MHRGCLKSTGYFEDEVAVEVFRATNKKTAPVEELEGGLQNDLILLRYAHVHPCTVTVDVLEGNVQLMLARQ